ncbi:hypothetical protein ACQY0O_007827 [Thecaphora frezii]
MTSSSTDTAATASSGGSQRSILLLNGPNLNLLGTREPEKYGHTTLASVHEAASRQCQAAGWGLAAYQSNHEGALIDRIHAARLDGTTAIVFNPGAYAHYSIAIRDALASVNLPVVEVHITNVHAREEFRHHSVVSPVARGIVVGLGTFGYTAAIDYCLNQL